jgi:hypothetical protein
LGFGFYACLFLVYSVAELHLGPKWDKFLDPVLPVGYVATVLIWVIAVMAPARELTLQELPKLQNIEQWDAAIREFLQR